MRNPSRPTLTKLTLGLGLCCAAVAASAQTLVLDLVDANASPITVNAQGHILGYQQSWPCGNPTLCAPQTLPAVWRDGQALRLPTQVGLSAAPAALSPSGMAVGSLTDYGSTAKAVVWQFNGTSYGIQELGQLGLAQSAATAVDQQERVIGYALTPMVSTKPFVWTAASGMTDLSTQGYPASRPWRISPQGWVVADAHRYRLGDPSTVTSLPVPPTGYRAPTGQSLRINDSGDLAGVLLTTSSSSNLGGMHRWLDASQQWQALGGALPLRNVGVSSLEADATVLGTGLGGAILAQGPSGQPQALQERLSTAYTSVGLVSTAGRDAQGRHVVAVTLGTVTRLARAVETGPCTGACLRVGPLSISGTFISDPAAPGSCTPKARQKVQTVATVTDAAGNPQSAVTVKGRYLDSYGLSQTVTGKTNTQGQVTLSHSGPACRGTITLLVESATKKQWRFDRTVGSLNASVIPLP
ncbi:hypothetical protein [Ideonella paludis]|uniref:Big-1 domain-containing protein n=1 Tax=Ideonella paludis TaxID=1233411 RepID=A0ABS5DWJ7_9BURK|nr:hypothetical protein [Ideonella paludis]MBQ0935523.1 hypothetical protein [Ideonella paludis]